VLPNPVLNEFTISSSSDLQNASYSIFTLHGSLAATGMFGPGIIKAYGLKAGVYYLCLYKDKKLVSRMTLSKM
jgi:hypothetical protein